MKEHQAKSTKRILASLLAASMAAGMVPITALAEAKVDDTLDPGRATATNQLTQYVDLNTVGMQSGSEIKQPDDPGTEPPKDLFDGKTSTKAGINKEANDTPTSVTWQTTQPVQVENYTLAGGNDSEDRDPKSWMLYGSNDGSQYTPIDQVTDAVLNDNFPDDYSCYYPEDYAVDSPAFYSYYKIEFTDYRGDESYFQLSEIVLSGEAEQTSEEVTIPDEVLHFDFANGATDASGNGNNGRLGSDVTIANGIATFAGGKNDKSVIVIDNPIAKRENLTVSAMVKVDSQPAEWATLWEAWSDDSTGGKLIRVSLQDKDTKNVFAQTRMLVDGSPKATKLDGGVQMPVGEWTEITFVAEGNTMRLYVNGKLLNEFSKPESVIAPSDLADAAKIYLGRDPQWNDNGLTGQMSDFRVYNQALTADQIAAVYAENLEEFAFNPGERPADEAAGAVYDQIMALPDTITYKQGNEIRQARADYNALTAEQQEMLSEELMQKLSAAEESLQAIYDAVTVTFTGWPTSEPSRAKWATTATEEQKQATRDAMADEIRYLYEMKEYRVGGKWMTDTIEVGVMRNWVGFETEVNDANDTDAPGNPWGHGNRYMSYLMSPFAGVAFAAPGYFYYNTGDWSEKDGPLLGTPFAYNGQMYGVLFNKVYYYSVDDTDNKPDGSKTVHNYENYPGKGKAEWGDMTHNTFRYAVARYNQEHKWENLVAGVPMEGVYYNEQVPGMKFHQLEGPQGTSYVAATDAAISAADENSAQPTGAYMVIGVMARALESLDADASETGLNVVDAFTLTGAPVGDAVEAEDGTVTQQFANGLLYAKDGRYAFFPSTDAEGLEAALQKVSAAADAIAAVVIDGETTLESFKTAVGAAETACGEVPETARTLIDNYANLAVFSKAVTDIEAANTLITNLPEADTIDDVEAAQNARESLEAAEAAVTALDETYKGLLPAASLEKLEAVRAAVDTQLEEILISEVETAITAAANITGETTLDSLKTAVAAAQEAYNKLGSDLQGKVENYATLTGLVEAIEDIEAADALISKLPEANTIVDKTTADAATADLEAAEDAVEALDDTYEALVPQLAKLTAVRQAVDAAL